MLKKIITLYFSLVIYNSFSQELVTIDSDLVYSKPSTKSVKYNIAKMENLGTCVLSRDTLKITLISGDGLSREVINLSFSDKPLRLIEKSILRYSDVEEIELDLHLGKIQPDFDVVSIVFNTNPFLNRDSLLVGYIHSNLEFPQSLVFKCYSKPYTATQDMKIAGRDYLVAPQISAHIIYGESSLYQKSDLVGSVYIELFIDERGVHNQPVIMKSSNRYLNEEALKVIDSLRFSPASNNGKVVTQLKTILIDFSSDY